MRTHTAVAALLIAVSTLASAVSAAPADATQLQVQVVDGRNASLSGATVTIYTLDGKPGVTATVDANGVARFESLVPGLTQVVVRADQFASSIDKVTLTAGDNTRTVKLHHVSDES
jgi:hypothetical protein